MHDRAASAVTRPGTRTRILVTSLLLFNEHGEANTTTNDIADETDISPGNLHYHFRKKSEIIDALIAEFQADARQVLHPPDDDVAAIEQFADFLHLLIEVLEAYRFLIRDTEIMVESYPQVARAIKGFTAGLLAVAELYIDALCEAEIVDVPDSEIHELSRNLATVALFSRRLDANLGVKDSVRLSASRGISAIIALLLPYADEDASEVLNILVEQYQP